METTTLELVFGVLPLTVRRLAFVADFATQNFNLKTKIEIKNKPEKTWKCGVFFLYLLCNK